MAADGLITGGSIRDGFLTKIRKRKDGALAGAAGNGALAQAYLDWFANPSPKKGKPPPLCVDNETATIFMVEPNGQIVMIRHYGPMRVNAPYYAMGSGEEIALGAMEFGATAEQAVEVAGKLDVNTGPLHTVFYLGPELKTRKKRKPRAKR